MLWNLELVGTSMFIPQSLNGVISERTYMKMQMSSFPSITAKRYHSAVGCSI
jgi:hypothetical protein